MKLLLGVLAISAASLAAPNEPGGRIFGGMDATRGEFPSIVSLHFCFLGYCTHACGATILSSRWLLTAGHCITDLPSIGSLYVLAGVIRLDDVNIERQYISTNYSVVHPDYAGDVSPHDIALIRLPSRLILNSQVQPARLPEAWSEPEGWARTAGWGSYGGIILPQMPNTLQRVNLPIVPYEECNDVLNTILQGEPHPLDREGHLCTGPLNLPISVCSGDSGGPLLQGDVILGVVSWGIVPCGRPEAPSVFVKVSNYIEWILKSVDEPLLLS